MSGSRGFFRAKTAYFKEVPLAYDDLDKSVKAGARLGPRLSSVYARCAGHACYPNCIQELAAYLQLALRSLDNFACMAEAVCARELLWDQMVEGGLFVS